MPHCARCLYPLAGLPSDAPCPECGNIHRQDGPYPVVDGEVAYSVTFAILTVLSLFLFVLGFWPGLSVTSFFALLTIHFGEISVRSRRHRDLSPSVAALLARCVAWGVISIYISLLTVWVVLSIFPLL